MLAASMPLLDDNLTLWIRNKALPAAQADLSSYRASRMNLVFDEDVYGETSFLALNPGQGYGLLRSLDPDERPNPRDVVIYETLPNELPRVAGIISTVPQTPLSHVNLRALQDSVPNAFIADALEDDYIGDLIDSYIYYAVTETGYWIRAATQSEVDEHFASSRPAEGQTPQRDLTVISITPLSEIGFDDWDSFGVKAANVAVLGTLGFPEGTVPDGFAVPFYFYDEFMKHNGLYDDIEEMLADSDFQTDYDTKADKLKKLRKKIKKAETPGWIETALTTMHTSFPEGTSLRYRSGTNNEDLPGFNGAGLYDSKTQHPEETEEDGISKSLKQVYASMWNFRAFIERDFHRIDHLAAAMGVLVHPNYSDEQVNGVAVSVDPAYGTEGTYYVNSQIGEDLVTNPEAHSVPEEVLLYLDGTYAAAALSNQVPPGQLLMTAAQLGQLRQHLAAIHEKFEELYGIEDGERFAMEIEFKITSDDILAIKQARPWIFTDHPPEIEADRIGATDAALTGSFDIAPATHDGNPFSVRVRFSEIITLLRDEMAEHAVMVTGGKVKMVERVNRRNHLWDIWVIPDSQADVTTVALPHNRPCTVLGAICTFGGWRLSTQIEHTVEGPLPGVSDRPKGNALSSDSVDLEWNDLPRADSYEVQFMHADQWIDLPANGTEIAFDGAGAVVRGLPASEVYYFRVRALNSSGASAWSAHLFLPVKVILESDLIAGHKTDFFPAVSGYSIFGDLGGTLTPGRFLVDGTIYRVWQLFHASEGLWLGMDQELPADFTLRVGDSIYLGRESMVPFPIGGVNAYWWPSAPPDWLGDGPVEVALILHPGVPLGDRQKAPVTGYFSKFPSEHDGSGDVSFRIYFSEDVATTADALRDHVLSVTGGAVSSVKPVGSEGTIWAFSVTPESREPVTIQIEANLDCALPDAVCTADGRRLFNRLELTVEAKEYNAPAGAPTISGTVEVGETTMADTSGISDADGLTGATFSYQWVSNDGSTDNDIQDATASTYTLVAADEGKTIKVRVSFTDDGGNDETLTSDATVAVTAVPPTNTPATGAPAISGAAQVGETLTADTSGIADEDGLDNATFSYQWIGNDGSTDTDIQDATGSSYTLVADDQGKTVKVRVSFTDDGGNDETLTSAATVAVAALPPEPLTASFEAMPSGHDGENAFTFELRFSEEFSRSYETLRDHAFTVTGGTVKKAQRMDKPSNIHWRITVEPDSSADVTVVLPVTTGCDDQGAVCTEDGRMLSNRLEFTVPGPPQNTAAEGGPAISGTPTVGQTLSAATTGISDADGLANAVFNYQWLAGDAEIAGATNAAYTVAETDLGEAISVRVTFIDDAGNEETLTSAATEAVAAARPPLTARFLGAPESHDGSAEFTFELRFSEEPKSDFSYRTLLDHAFTVTGGEISGVHRLEPPGNTRWEIQVRPNSESNLEIVLPVTTDCAADGAVCTGDGRMLSNRLEITVPGPGG